MLLLYLNLARQVGGGGGGWVAAVSINIKTVKRRHVRIYSDMGEGKVGYR